MKRWLLTGALCLVALPAGAVPMLDLTGQVVEIDPPIPIVPVDISTTTTFYGPGTQIVTENGYVYRQENGWHLIGHLISVPSTNLVAAPVPEPSTVVLLGLALVLLGGWRCGRIGAGRAAPSAGR